MLELTRGAGSRHDRARSKGMGSEKTRSHKFYVGLEYLEGRALLAASLAPIPNVSVQQYLGYQVPLDGSAAGTAQTYTVTSDNPQIPVSVAKGQFLTLNVSHASSGANDPAFNGSITFQLFEDLTPLTASKIEQLVTSGFYNGKNFHRVANNFPGTTDYIVQGGSVNGAGLDQPPAPGQPGGLPATGFPFIDEPNQQLAFTGTYQLAMANAGPDTNSSQFFITTGSPQFLNFHHTIFGQVVSGVDIVQKMTKVAVGSDGTTPASPILISSATLSTTNPNGVVHVDATQAPANAVAHVTVTAHDPSTNTNATQTFSVTATPFQQSNNSRAFLTSYPTNVTVGQGQTAVYKITGVGPEPSDTLTYTVQGGLSGSSWTPVQNATASVDSNGVVTVKPNAGFSGTITLLVGVRDQVDRSGTGTVETPSNYQTHQMTVTVNPSSTPINLTPIALPQTLAVPVNAASPIQLLGNTANPQSSQTLSYQIIQPPLHGTLSAVNQSNGTLTYTPTSGYTGPDNFQYTVTDVGAPTPNLTSPPATISLNVTQGSTNAVRVIGRVLVVTPPPRTDGGTNNIKVAEVNGVFQVTLNGLTDVLQPSSASVDTVVVYGSKANDNITIDPSVNVPATIDGGHGGKNTLVAGQIGSILHGWFGKNTMTGSPQYDLMYGRKGHVKFIKSAGNDSMATVVINNKTKGGHQHKLRNAPHPRFFKWVGNQLKEVRAPKPGQVQQDPPPTA